MDIQHLIDKLEDLIDEGRHIPMSKYTTIDEERALGLIDQMRIAVPEQIESATRVVDQREQIMTQAQQEAQRVLDEARRKSEELLNRDSIAANARHQADGIITKAQVDADAIRAEADAYVVEVLRELESHLLRTLTVVRNGIAKVMQDHEASAQARVSRQHVPATMPVPQRESVEVSQDNDPS